MKIATYNVNGISSRLPVLMRWLEETSPDVACLQELKTTDEKFPALAMTQVGYNAMSKEAYKRLLDQGWTDSIRKLHPDEKIFTYWDYFRNAFARNAGIRMDHILLNPVLAPRLVAGAVDTHVRGWEKTSDHAPVWIEIKD